MQTHQDFDSEFGRNPALEYVNANRDEFMKSLEEKAAKIRAAGGSDITGGRDGEQVLNEWKRKGVTVRELPRDEHGILRISVGGGSDTPVALDYCVFRGSHTKCVELLRRALIALQEGPED